MPYPDEIAKVEQNVAVEFYEFQVRNSYYRYCGFFQNETFLGQSFEAATIKRSGFSVDEKFKAIQTTITAPISNLFASTFASAPISEIKVKIWKAFLPVYDDAYRVMFLGKAKSVRVNNKVLQVLCESLSNLTRTVVPKIMYQSYCNHTIFDNGCKLIAASWKLSAQITSILSNQIASPSFATKPDKYYRGGMVFLSSGDDARLVTNHVGDTLTLHFPFRGSSLQVGDNVDVYPGCDKSGLTCSVKFDNVPNRLSFDYIPDKNPVIVGFR